MVDYEKLQEAVQALRPYYDIDKIKPWSVYVWTKNALNEDGENIFDIELDRIVCYGNFKETDIIPETLPIIANIQKFLEKY